MATHNSKSDLPLAVDKVFGFFQFSCLPLYCFSQYHLGVTLCILAPHKNRFYGLGVARRFIKRNPLRLGPFFRLWTRRKTTTDCSSIAIKKTFFSADIYKCNFKTKVSWQQGKKFFKRIDIIWPHLFQGLSQ